MEKFDTKTFVADPSFTVATSFDALTSYVDVLTNFKVSLDQMFIETPEDVEKMKTDVIDQIFKNILVVARELDGAAMARDYIRNLGGLNLSAIPHGASLDNFKDWISGSMIIEASQNPDASFDPDTNPDTNPDHE